MIYFPGRNTTITTNTGGNACLKKNREKEVMFLAS
jgi:hypothetical protein